MITIGSVLLLAIWLLFACVAPPGEDAAAAPREVRGLQGETCKTFTSTDVPKAIPDEGDEVPAGAFTTSKLTAGMAGYITDLTVTFTINHEYPGDLLIVLCGPRNLNCQLVYGDLTSAAGIYTLAFSSDPTHTDFDDIYDGPPYTGSYPADPSYEPSGLAKFRNAAAAGEWQLGFLDTGAGDVGSLTAWSLELCTMPLKSTATPTVTALPTAPLNTPVNGCGKHTYYAKRNFSGGDSCDCSDPDFEEYPLSDAGDLPLDRQGILCFNNCPGSSVSVDAHTRAQAYGNYFAPGAGVRAWIVAPRFTPPVTSLTDQDIVPGCYPIYSSYDLTGTHNGFSDIFSIDIYAINSALCTEDPTTIWSYDIEFSPCVMPTATPTRTPLPTATRPCPTSVVGQTGWWMW